MENVRSRFDGQTFRIELDFDLDANGHFVISREAWTEGLYRLLCVATGRWSLVDLVAALVSGLSKLKGGFPDLLGG